MWLNETTEVVADIKRHDFFTGGLLLQPTLTQTWQL